MALTSGADPPTRVGAVTVDSGEDYLVSAVIDPAAGYAWFGTGTSPGGVVKVALGSGANPPSRVGAVTLASGEDGLVSAVIDPAAGYAYFGTATSPGIVVRVGLSQQGFVKATKLTLPEPGRVTHVSFYAHAATGRHRLALYDNAPVRHLLWQSGPLNTTSAGAWHTTAVADGTPPTLDLPAGTYWLAWQVDTAVPVPSWAAGSAGDGLFVPWAWGDFPPTLNPVAATAPTLTDEIWSAYLTYETPKTLTVTKTGTGSGTVTSVPAGIDCGATCSASFAHGTQVTLTATPAAGSTFAGWSGGCAGTNPTTTVTMAADTTCTATFNTNLYTVTLVTTPAAGGSVTCTPNPVPHGQSAVCTITVNPGYTLRGVVGTCGGTLVGSTYTTNPITGPCTVEVRFAQLEAIPTLSTWGLVLFLLGTGLMGIAYLRRRATLAQG